MVGLVRLRFGPAFVRCGFVRNGQGSVSIRFLVRVIRFRLWSGELQLQFGSNGPGSVQIRFMCHLNRFRFRFRGGPSSISVRFRFRSMRSISKQCKSKQGNVYRSHRFSSVPGTPLVLSPWAHRRSSNLPGKTCSTSKPGSCVLAV